MEMRYLGLADRLGMVGIQWDLLYCWHMYLVSIGLEMLLLLIGTIHRKKYLGIYNIGKKYLICGGKTRGCPFAFATTSPALRGILLRD